MSGSVTVLELESRLHDEWTNYREQLLHHLFVAYLRVPIPGFERQAKHEMAAMHEASRHGRFDEAAAHGWLAAAWLNELRATPPLAAPPAPTQPPRTKDEGPIASLPLPTSADSLRLRTYPVPG